MWAFLRRLVCSHNYSIASDSGVMFLRCVECGHQTSGWSLNEAQGVSSPPSSPVVTVRCRVLPGPHADLNETWLSERRAIRAAGPVEVVVPHEPQELSIAAEREPARTAVIYACTAASGQDLESELEELRRHVARRGWQAVEYVEEHSVDAKDRPVLQRVLEEARHQHIDLLVCWRLDRLAHRATQLLLLFDELTSLGVAVVSVSDDIDTVAPDGKVQMPLVSALASLERQRRANLVVAAQNGRQRRAKRRRGSAEGGMASIRNLPFTESGRLHAVPSANAHRNEVVSHQSVIHAKREHADVDEFLSEADEQVAPDTKRDATLPHTTNGPIRTPHDSDGRNEQGYRARAT